MSLFRHFATKLRPILFQFIRRSNWGFVRNQTGAFLLSSAVIHDLEINEEDTDFLEIKNAKVEDFNDLIKQACDLTEERIKTLIKLVKGSIVKSCEEYRKLIDKQMDILKKGDGVDPLSPLWDELVKYRVEADNLKQEIMKFQSLVEYVEKLILNLHICRSMMETIDKNLPDIEKDLQTLKQLKEEQLKLNKKVEQELLKLNALDILKGKT